MMAFIEILEKVTSALKQSQTPADARFQPQTSLNDLELDEGESKLSASEFSDF